MDFWRPNYRTTAIVDGKLSLEAYLRAVEGTWKDYTEQGGRALSEIAAFCYHQPFTRMAHKAHRHLLSCYGQTTERQSVDEAVGRTTAYNSEIGNSYTASMYIGLAALLESPGDLTERSIGFLSYGSGSVAEFFTGTVTSGYSEHLRTDEHRHAVARRTPIGYDTYRELREYVLPSCGEDHVSPRQTSGPYRLDALRCHKRLY